MAETAHGAEKVKVTIRVNQIQYPLIERVLSEGSMGSTEAEVIRNGFLDYYRKKVQGDKPVSITGVSRDHDTDTS
jgi:hypothetical protein